MRTVSIPALTFLESFRFKNIVSITYKLFSCIQHEKPYRTPDKMWNLYDKGSVRSTDCRLKWLVLPLPWPVPRCHSAIIIFLKLFIIYLHCRFAIPAISIFILDAHHSRQWKIVIWIFFPIACFLLSSKPLISPTTLEPHIKSDNTVV